MFMQKLTPQAPQTEQQQIGEFATVRRKILQIQDDWNTFHEEFSQLDSPYTEEFQQHNQDFSQAVNKILAAIETPTLTLATTGTTSSGKSTLVNLLCGADIMPRMAGEMSAGIVTIKHASDGKRLLKIENTANAAWEGGEWEDPSDYDIRERLTDTMDAFNKAKQERELHSPVIELTYPIACFSSNAGMMDLSSLPPQTQFQVMDLPGKRNQDDKINSAVIQNCRHALSIVTYDMAQTDEKLRQTLIQEVLEQVKLMGGSPARMLFALNRVDVFRKDHDWEYREKEAAEQTIEEIKKILHERLPEHRHTLESLSYSKLSSLPALLAWQMNATEGEQRIIAAEEMDKQSGYMIPDHIRDDLPRKAEKWEERDFQQVQAAAWESSYAQDFFPVLEKHIHENFAKLIIDPLLIEFEGVVSPIIGQAERTCMIGIESANKKLEDIQEQLNIDYNVIDGELKVLHKDFMLLPNFIIESPENIDQLYNEKLPNSFKETEIYQDTHIKDILKGLPEAISEPIKWPSGISEGATQYLKSNHVGFLGTKAEELSHNKQEILESICNKLIGIGYNSDIAKNGQSLKATSYYENKELNKIKNAIESYASELSRFSQEIYEEKTKQGNERIQYLLEKIMNFFILILNEKIKEKSTKLPIRFDQSIFKDVILDISSIEFYIEIKGETKTEQNPWLLWIVEREVNYIDIPSTDEIHTNIVDYLKEKKLSPLRKVIYEYCQKIGEKMDDFLRDVCDDINIKLKSTYDEHKKNHQQQEEIWKSMDNAIKSMSSEFETLIAHKA